MAEFFFPMFYLIACCKLYCNIAFVVVLMLFLNYMDKVFWNRLVQVACYWFACILSEMIYCVLSGILICAYLLTYVLVSLHGLW